MPCQANLIQEPSSRSQPRLVEGGYLQPFVVGSPKDKSRHVGEAHAPTEVKTESQEALYTFAVVRSRHVRWEIEYGALASNPLAVSEEDVLVFGRRPDSR